ncbi:MAG: hypothetical protein MI723_11895, partial [Caulobacterales bacterium]|nr:hypothetical protein [Caulobacterales bacterium]
PAVSPAVAHGPPDTPAEPGPTSELLLEHPVLAIFPGMASVPMYLEEGGRLKYIEVNQEDMSQSVKGEASWTWDEKDLCMYAQGNKMCYALDPVVTPGEVYDTAFRMYNERGEEEVVLDARLMLVR